MRRERFKLFLCLVFVVASGCDVIMPELYNDVLEVRSFGKRLASGYNIYTLDSFSTKVSIGFLGTLDPDTSYYQPSVIIYEGDEHDWDVLGTFTGKEQVRRRQSKEYSLNHGGPKIKFYAELRSDSLTNDNVLLKLSEIIVDGH